jgi:hypothetical protein
VQIDVQVRLWLIRKIRLCQVHSKLPALTRLHVVSPPTKVLHYWINFWEVFRAPGSSIWSIHSATMAGVTSLAIFEPYLGIYVLGANYTETDSWYSFGFDVKWGELTFQTWSFPPSTTFRPWPIYSDKDKTKIDYYSLVLDPCNLHPEYPAIQLFARPVTPSQSGSDIRGSDSSSGFLQGLDSTSNFPGSVSRGQRW